MTIHEFKRPKNVENVLDFLDAAKEAMAKPEDRPYAVILLTYFKMEDGTAAMGMNLGGKDLNGIEASGLLSMAKSRLEFADNVMDMQE